MTRVLACGLAFAALLAGAAVTAQPVTEEEVGTGVAMVSVREVHLRGLDNLNGTARDIDLAVGETARFGHLEITVDTCRVPRDTPKADAFAFLRIRDIRETAPRFAGWMFASSPALSALDHPRYDVWVLSCSIY